jgi:DNA repair protein RadC
MRARFVGTAGIGMADHEILEMLLFYALPRCDTNGIAHALIEEFGSLDGVLEAEISSLCRVEGISEASATYLRLVGNTAQRFLTDKMRPQKSSALLDTPERIAQFLWPKFLSASGECVYLLLFDNSMHLIDCFLACEGGVSGVLVSIRRITERAYRKNAAAAVLAHNHPRGYAIPSGEDIRLTRRLDEALQLMEIPLLEHFVFGAHDYAPIMSKSRVQIPERYAASSLREVFALRQPECRAIDYAPAWWEQYQKEGLIE